MADISLTLAIQRLKPSPFGGVFDEILYEHPAFKLWLIAASALILAVVVAAVLLLRHSRRLRPRRDRGFEVAPVHSPEHSESSG